MTAEEIKEAKTFLAQESERGVTLPWADEALEHLRTMVIAYEPLLATCERLVKALERLNVCEACEGEGELEYPCLKCGGEDVSCQHTVGAMECPCCGGSKVRDAEASTALAEAKKVQNG